MTSQTLPFSGLILLLAIGVKDNLPDNIYTAHLMPRGSEKLVDVSPTVNFHRFDLDFMSFIESLEEEMDRKGCLTRRI